MFVKNSSNAWVLRTSMPGTTPGACLASDSVDDCVKKIHTQFCNSLNTPNVTDPTNSSAFRRQQARDRVAEAASAARDDNRLSKNTSSHVVTGYMLVRLLWPALSRANCMK